MFMFLKSSFVYTYTVIAQEAAEIVYSDDQLDASLIIYVF